MFVKTRQRIDSTSLGRTKSYDNVGYIYICYLAIIQSPMAFYMLTLFDLPIFIIWILCVYRLSVINEEIMVTESINMEVAISTAHICKVWILWISYNILNDKHYVEDVMHWIHRNTTLSICYELVTINTTTDILPTSGENPHCIPDYWMTEICNHVIPWILSMVLFRSLQTRKKKQKSIVNLTHQIVYNPPNSYSFKLGTLMAQHYNE